MADLDITDGVDPATALNKADKIKVEFNQTIGHWHQNLPHDVRSCIKDFLPYRKARL